MLYHQGHNSQNPTHHRSQNVYERCTFFTLFFFLLSLICFSLRFECTALIDHSARSRCASEGRRGQTLVNKLSGENAQRQRDQQTPPAHNGGEKRPSRPRTASVDSCSELASVKRGTISCPNASEKKSTQGTRANIFSTQIGYSNYPRLFNLATRLRALFQVPSTIGEIGEFGVGEGLAIFPAVTSFRA